MFPSLWIKSWSHWFPGSCQQCDSCPW